MFVCMYSPMAKNYLHRERGQFKYTQGWIMSMSIYRYVCVCMWRHREDGMWSYRKETNCQLTGTSILFDRARCTHFSTLYKQDFFFFFMDYSINSIVYIILKYQEEEEKAHNISCHLQIYFILWIIHEYILNEFFFSLCRKKSFSFTLIEMKCVERCFNVGLHTGYI